jgi:hypothetical protein
LNGDSYRLNQSKRRSHRSSSDTPADHPTRTRPVNTALLNDRGCESCDYS